MATKKCKWCGDQFRTTNPLQLFCCRKCAGRQNAHDRRRRLAHTLKCRICGQTFRSSRNDAMTCGPSCLRVQRSRAAREQNRKKEAGEFPQEVQRDVRPHWNIADHCTVKIIYYHP